MIDNPIGSGPRAPCLPAELVHCADLLDFEAGRAARTGPSETTLAELQLIFRFQLCEPRPMWRSDYSSIATARVQPAEPAFTFTGKQITVKPVAGSWSRFASFSIWQ